MPSHSLQLSQQQRQIMIMAPQLRQSLEILHLPVMELRALIQGEMAENPVIEDVVDPAEQRLEELAAAPDDGADAPAPAKDEKNQEADFDTEFAALEQMDAEWRDYFLSGMENAGDIEEQQERREYWLNSLVAPVSMYDTLAVQLELLELDGRARMFAELIIMNLDADGYFRGDLPGLAEEAGLDPEAGEHVLKAVQNLDPPGIAARDLREALLLQLERMDETPVTILAKRVVGECLHELAAHKRKAIAATLKTGQEELDAAIALIKKLDPKPGLKLDADPPEYIEPEVEVIRENGRWAVKLDETHLPHIRISRHYRRLLDDPATDDTTKAYIRERIRAGAVLIKSIHQRQRTITRIASEIVDAQQAFLDHGPARLRPMTMVEVAGKVGVHETTVSRTVANKYIRTPQGVFELKYFFTPGVKTSSGETVSNRAVQDRIAHLVAAENPADPLSDQTLQEMLNKEGFHIARRTVAKYRMALKIPSSQLRKRA